MSFFTAGSGKSMARLLYAVLVVGSIAAVLTGKLTGSAASAAIVGLATGLGAAWVSGKLRRPQ